VTYQKSITDELIEWLHSVAGDVREDMSYVRWIGEHKGINDPDASFVYCNDCCDKEVDRLNALHPGSEHFADGGSRSQEESFKYCELCSAQLDCGLTEYGAREVAAEFTEGGFDLGQESNRRETAADLMEVADQLCYSYDKDVKVQAFFSALMAARMNEIIAPFQNPETAAPAIPLPRQARRSAI